MPGWLSKFPTANHIVEEHLLANNIPRPRHWPSSLFFHANMEASGSKWNPAGTLPLWVRWYTCCSVRLSTPILTGDFSSTWRSSSSYRYFQTYASPQDMLALRRTLYSTIQLVSLVLACADNRHAKNMEQVEVILFYCFQMNGTVV